MKGDFTRDTFAPESHYASVRLQQGRVLLDADWNEQADIAAHQQEAETNDVVGPCGAPLHDAALGVLTSLAAVTDPAEAALLAALLPNGLAHGDFLLGPGRFYADGILCENEHYVPYTLQPDLPGTTPLDVSTQNMRYLLYLDVWRRHIGALDDPRLREVALGGPDTATRARTIWQVRALATGTGALHCPDTVAAYDAATAPSTGTMRAQAVPESTADSPCIVPPSAGYTGLENQLYRIEIHDPGTGFDPGGGGGTALNAFPATDQVEYAGGSWNVGDVVEVYASNLPSDPMNGQLAVVVAKQTVSGKKRLTLNRNITALDAGTSPRLRKVGATYKWSRDNGIVVSSITAISGTDVTVESLGVDTVLDLEPGQWVEITDRARELSGQSGVLAQVDSVLPASRVVRLHAAPGWPGDLATVDPARGLRLRRWDGAGAVKYEPGVGGPGWIDLESGVQVAFDDGSYHAGDYWQVPARTASADARSGRVEWPTDAASKPVARLPFGIVHHYCRIGIVTVNADGTLAWHDCRDLFPPLTELTRLFHVGGDGQEAMPGDVMPQPLEAGVFNGDSPVAAAVVRFRAQFGGKLGLTPATAATGAATLDVPTSATGIAPCWWLPDPGTPFHTSQQVSATLLDDAGQDTVEVIHFDGNLSIADEVWYDPGACNALAGQGTVQQAISRLASLASLYLVDGGGQEVKPGEAINPLVVRVASACGPITDNRPRVHFKVTAGNGTLAGGGQEADLPLNPADGTVSCQWTLDPTTHDQEVVATLEGNGVPTAEPTTVRFTANLSAAVHVAYDPAHCPDMAQAGVADVQAAIDFLCSHGGCCKPVAPGTNTLSEAIKQAIEKGDCCLCLQRGVYTIEGGLDIPGGGPLRIQGCGPFSIIRIVGGPVILEKLPYLELRDLGVQTLGVDAPLQLTGCADVVISGCRLQVSDNAPTLLTVGGARTLRIVASRFRAFTDVIGTGGITNNALNLAAVPEFATFAEIRSYLNDTAAAIVDASKTKRTALTRALNTSADATDAAPQLAISLRATADAVAAAGPSAAELQPVLAAALLGRAIVLRDAVALTTIEDCDIAGEVRVYGNDGDVPAQLLKSIIAAHAENLTLTPGSGELVLRGNRLMRLSIDGQFQEHVQTAQNQPIVIDGIHSRAVLSDNEFALPNSILVAGSVTVASNTFNDSGSELDVLADVATAVGNVSPPNSTLHLFPTQLAREAGNLMNVSVT